MPISLGKGKVFSLGESLQWNGGVAARLEEGERGRKKEEARRGNATRQKERNVSDKGEYKSREAALFVWLC